MRLDSALLGLGTELSVGHTQPVSLFQPAICLGLASPAALPVLRGFLGLQTETCRSDHINHALLSALSFPIDDPELARQTRNASVGSCSQPAIFRATPRQLPPV